MAGRYTVCLLVAHVVLVLWGYAVQAHTSVLGESWTVVFTYPDMLKGTVGGLLLLTVGAVSARAVRRRVRYETWYYLHLLTYLAIFLAFWHQLALGADLARGGPARVFWYALYVSAAAAALWYRVLVPQRLNLRHRLRVLSVVREAPDVVSVVVGGERCPNWPPAPGSSSAGGSWPPGCGGRRARTRCRRHRAPTCCASPSRRSAGTARRWPGCGRAPGCGRRARTER